MLFASLVSEHVDEVLWLINHDRRVSVAWRRGGGHLLVRRLLHGPADRTCSSRPRSRATTSASLLRRFTAVLARARRSARLRCDVARFGGFAAGLARAHDLRHLDEAALGLVPLR